MLRKRQPLILEQRTLSVEQSSIDTRWLVGGRCRAAVFCSDSFPQRRGLVRRKNKESADCARQKPYRQEAEDSGAGSGDLVGHGVLGSGPGANIDFLSPSPGLSRDALSPTRRAFWGGPLRTGRLRVEYGEHGLQFWLEEGRNYA
jgi:hypothetical protein